MRLFILVFFTGIGFASKAQNYSDIINVNYQYLKINPDDYDQKAFETGLKIKVPIRLNDDKDYLIIGGRLNQFRHTSSLFPDTESRLSIIEGNLSYFNKLKGTAWSYMLQTHAGIYSDFISPDAGHLQYGGYGLGYYRVNENICFSLGIFYHKEAYGPFVIPIGGFEWSVNERLFIYVLFPYLINVEYKLKDRFYVGGEINFIAETYKISQTDSNQIVDYVVDRPVGFPWSYLEVNAFFDFYITEKFVVFAKPGFTYLRRLELYDENDVLINSKSLPHGLFDLSPFVKFGLSFRIRN
jgi:Domain of unknown function (DUF6268)